MPAARARSQPRHARTLAPLVGAALLLACGARDPAGLHLRIAAVRQPATSLYFVAQSAGCFEREGLALDERTFELGRDAMGLLEKRAADVAIAFETVVVRTAETDPRLRVLTALHHSSRNTRLVARRGRGIESFAGLAGKRIGLSLGTNADFFVELVLRFGGVDRASVDVVDLPPAASAAALVAGTLDAAVLSDPFADQAERALGAEASTLHSELYAEFSLLVTHEDTIAARGPALRALLRGLACGERIAREHPDRALTWTARHFSGLDDAQLRRQLARVSWGIGLDHLLLDVLREEQAWSARRSPGARAPASRDVSALVAPALLEEVEPDAVMLLPSPGSAR